MHTRILISSAVWCGLGCMLAGTTARAQSDSLSLTATAVYTVETTALVSSGSRTPFWLAANRYGTVPAAGSAGIVRVGTSGRLGYGQRHWFGYGLEVVGNGSRQSGVVLPQAFGAYNLGRFSLWAGRRKEVIGVGDTTMTSGFYSWSTNALPITKVQLGTNGFAPLGFTRGLVAINAFFAHGWFANTDSIQGSFLHQKAIYIRVGRPNSRVRLYGGVLHNAQWGGRSAYVSPMATVNGQIPGDLKTYLYVVTARDAGQSQDATAFDAVNRFGNHLGSIDFGADIHLNRWNLLGYYQHPYEDKSGVAFTNMPDGLYGLRLKRADQPGPGIRLSHVLFEYLNTMSQGGSQVHTGARYDGQDDYFNNYQYLDGWAQYGRVIGTPFMARRADLRPERQQEPGRQIWAIASNRVRMGHLALAGTLGRTMHWQTRLSLSQHSGTYRHPFVQSVNQFSGAFWLTWSRPWLGGSDVQLALATDQGNLYTNTTGGWLTLRKTWKTVR